jgi:hypothetical protein
MGRERVPDQDLCDLDAATDQSEGVSGFVDRSVQVVIVADRMELVSRGVWA